MRASRLDAPWPTRVAAWGLWILAGMVVIVTFALAMLLFLGTLLVRGPRDPLDVQTIGLSLVVLAVGGAVAAALYGLGRGLMDLHVWAWLLSQAVYCMTALLAGGGEVADRLILGHRRHLGQADALALALPSVVMLVLLLTPASIQHVLRPLPFGRHQNARPESRRGRDGRRGRGRHGG